MMNGAINAVLDDGRLHLQHGPIDLIIEAWADQPNEIKLAYQQASMRFSGLLASLVEELRQLRTPLSDTYPLFGGPVAKRMASAVWPYRGQFITPMAAVAGAVADEILAVMLQQRDIKRAYVNNGGDIALHLVPGEAFDIGIAGIEDAAVKGQFIIAADDGIRGVATSGWRGRSFSLGIADSVTVLARTAAEADAAATMIANAVNIDHPGIERVPAYEIREDSDLGSLLVTRHVPAFNRASVNAALYAGAETAQRYQRNGLFNYAVLRLQGEVRLVGGSDKILGPAGTKKFVCAM